MHSATSSRKRDRLRQWLFRRAPYHAISQESVQQYAQDQISDQPIQQVHSDVSQPNTSTATVPRDDSEGQLSERVLLEAYNTDVQHGLSTLSTIKNTNLQYRVFKLLSEDDKDIIRDSIGPEIRNLQEIIKSAHEAAVLKLKECASKKWTIKFGNQEFLIEDKAKKVVTWLDRFKLAGDVAVNVDPLHAGLPWAIIRILLEAATSEFHQMGALFLGLEEISDMSQRLESYVGYLNELENTKPRQNFENTIVKFHALILQFVASALRTYRKSRMSRGFTAFWKVDDISKYKEDFAKLASQAEANASICERDLARQHQEQQIIDKLPYLANAAYTSAGDGRHKSCLENTRVNVLQNIISWTTKEASKNIYWVRGPAGAGKSTIAMTIAQKLEQEAVILTSFFFLRGGGELAQFGKVITTIAFQLAQQSLWLKKFIYDALKNKPELANSVSFKIQFRELIFHPVRRFREEAKESRAVVIILDALDECDDDDQIQKFLAYLGECQEMADMNIRLLLASRPDYQIRLELENVEHKELALNDVDQYTVYSDILRFMTNEFDKVKDKRKLPDCWPGDYVIQGLASNADGSFIYAATICRYICDRGGALAETRLEQVFAVEKNALHASLEPLEEMYSMVLKNSIDNFHTPEEVEDFRCLLGSIILSFSFLSIRELEGLMFPDKLKNGRFVQGILDSMHAVLDIPTDPNELIQIHHLSFRDFLLSSDRSRKSGFYMDEEEGHRVLFDRCLNLMSTRLQRNICNLTTGTLIQSCSDASSKHISSQLRYACTNWIDHADCGNVKLEDGGLLHQFLMGNMLYWLEVIVLLDLWHGIQPLVESLIKKLHETDSPTAQVASLLENACQMITDFGTILKYFPLHLYSTVLMFSRQDGVIRQKFLDQIDARIGIQTEYPVDKHEAGCSEIVTVIILPEKSLVFSCSRVGVIKVWEDQSGKYRLRKTFECDYPDIRRMNVSFDGSLASLLWEGNSIIVIDASTGKELHHSHNLGMDHVAFSPVNFLVAYTIWEQDIEVWDTRTGESRFTLHLQSEYIYDMVFSKTGCQLASSTRDGSVCIWDMQRGECTQTLMEYCGQDSRLLYSPDGLLLSSLSTERIMRVWNVTCGLEILCLEIPYRFDAWEFNADSSWIRLRGITFRRGILEQKDIPIPSRALKLSQFDHVGRNIGSYYGWVTYGLERIFHIPAFYRSALDCHGSKLVSGSNDGTMTFVHYIEDEGELDSNSPTAALKLPETLNRDDFFNSTDSFSSFESFSASDGSWGAWDVPSEDNPW